MRSKNSKIAFTKSSLDALQPRLVDYQVSDTKVAGLVLRVNIGGTKTFMFHRRINKKLHRKNIGRYPYCSIDIARRKVTEINAGIEVTRNALAPAPISVDLPFRDLFEQYYTEHLLPHAKTAQTIRRTIYFHLIPKIGDLKASMITKAVMRDLHRKQGLARGKQEANRVLDLASSMFNYCSREGSFTGTNPCLGIKRFKKKSRDRFLNRDELKLFAHALKLEDQLFQDFFLLSLCTGARKSTVLTMKFSQIDFELNRWRLPEDESKNDDVNIYVLTDFAVSILQRRYYENMVSEIPTDYVFPGRGKDGHLVNPRKSFLRIRERMNVHDITIHDLRRTLGSYMAINNSSLPIIAKALNHKCMDSTQIYARLLLEPVRDAVEQATNTILAGIGATNTPIPKPMYYCTTNFTFSKRSVSSVAVPELG